MSVVEEQTPPLAVAQPRRRSSTRRFLITVLVLGAVVFGVLRLVPTGDYVFLPNEARPVDPLIAVPSEPANDTGEARAGGIYMVDILVRKATVFEKLFPGVTEGAEIVPGEQLNPDGVSEDQRTKRATTQMATSREISAAVALQALGHDVEISRLGAQVQLVTPESDGYGKLQPGDVIVRANGAQVRSSEDLRAALEGVAPGTVVALAVLDGDGERELAVATRQSERDPARAVIGIEVMDAARVDLPVEVEIDAGDVGGPSAGLAFALDIVDELGTEVDRGRTVVVTGEIALDGTVGPIGGMRQKTIGALRAGADVLVVPAENADVARRHAGDVPVIAAGTFQEALDGLGVRLPVS